MTLDDAIGAVPGAHPVDAHLDRFTGAQAKALQTTRARIAAALPGAEQVISYGMPTFKVDGVAVVGFDGFKAHNSLFPYSGSVVALVADARPEWTVSKGTIQFPLAEAFPAALLKRVIALRIDEINAGYPKSGGVAPRRLADAHRVVPRRRPGRGVDDLRPGRPRREDHSVLTRVHPAAWAGGSSADRALPGAGVETAAALVAVVCGLGPQGAAEEV